MVDLNSNMSIIIPTIKRLETSIKVTNFGDVSGGSVVKNPPANAGDTGSSPGLGRSHMPWSN